MENNFYNDDVERIVNESPRREIFENFVENRVQRVKSKLLESCICLCIAGIATTMCGIAGWLTWWVALPVSVGISLVAAFKFGRLYESARRRSKKR